MSPFLSGLRISQMAADNRKGKERHEKEFADPPEAPP
jgi:hypothetical protein